MQVLDRRRLLAAGSVGGIGLLGGCATLPAAGWRGVSTCLPRVIVDPGRVIRHAVGLRPYRASGFVVRAETVVDRRLVHNYGHGGAGITLSWGTARLATSLGLQGHSGEVAVIGAGVIGLTTARLVQEAGFPVTVYAAALPPDTTSNIAGGQWAPTGHYRASAVTAEWRTQLATALDFSWRRFQIMVGEDYGIRWLTTYHQGLLNPADPASAYQPGHRALGRTEHPFDLDGIVRYQTMYVETGRFLRQLLRDLQQAGGRIEVRNFGAPGELGQLAERLIFNCTGLGARALFDDQTLRPSRGQLVILLPQPEVDYAFSGEAGYMFPRPDGIVLGGTYEMDNWSLDPDPETARQILRSHRAVFDGLDCSRMR